MCIEGEGDSSVEREDVVDPLRLRDAMVRHALTKSCPNCVRCCAGSSSSSSGRGFTEDFQRILSHQLGTRCLLDESYTPLSSSSAAFKRRVPDFVELALFLNSGECSSASWSAALWLVGTFG